MALNVKDTHGPKLALQFRAGGKETRAAMEATGDAYMGAGSGAAYTLGLSGANKALEALGLPATTGASEDLRESLASATMEGDQARGVYEYEYEDEPYDLIEIEWALVPATKKKATKLTDYQIEALGQMHDDYRYGVQNSDTFLREHAAADFTDGEPGFEEIEQLETRGLLSSRGDDTSFGERRLTMVITDAGMSAYEDAREARSAAKKKAKKAPAKKKAAHAKKKAAKKTAPNSAQMKTLRAAATAFRKTHSGVSSHKRTTKEAGHMAAMEEMGLVRESLSTITPGFRTFQILNTGVALAEKAVKKKGTKSSVKLTGLKKAFLEAVPKKSGSVVGTVWSNIQMERMKGVSLPMRRAAIPKLKAAMTKALDELVESGKLVRTPHRDGTINPFNQIHHPKKGKKRNPAGHTVSGQGRVDAALLEFASGRRPADMNGLIDMGYMEHKHGTGMVLSLKGRKRLAQIKKSGIGVVKKATKKTPSAKPPKTRGETLTRPTGWRRGTRGGPVGAGAHGRAVARRNPQDGTPQRAYISVQGSDPGEPGTNWYASLQGVVDRPLDKTFAARPHMRSRGEAMRWAEREAVAHGWRLDAKKRTGEKKAPPSKTKSTKKNGSCTYSAALPEYCIEVVGENETQARSIRDTLRRGIEAAADICRMRPPVCRGNLGLTRDRMPQITGDANMREMLESDDRLDRAKARAIGQAGGKKSNHQTIQQQFLDWLETKGVRTKRERVRVGELMATQSEIKAAKAYSMANAHLRGDFPTIDKQIVISKDGYILDGHHRWAALLTLDPGRWMSVLRVGLPMSQARNGGPTLLGEAAAFPGVYTANFTGEPLTEAAQRRYKRDHKSQLGPQRKATKAKSPSLSCAELERVTKAKIAKL